MRLMLIVICLMLLPLHLMAQEMQNNAYVTLTGTVTMILQGDEFELDYGDGKIKVDTNDAWPNLFKSDAYHIGTALKTGDRVWVSGKIDDNWFRGRELDAYTIHHQQENKVVLYKAPSSRLLPGAPQDGMLPKSGEVVVTGFIVKLVNDNHFLLQYGSSAESSIKIDASGIDKTATTYAMGDRISVTGRINNRFFLQRELKATAMQPVPHATGGVRL